MQTVLIVLASVYGFGCVLSLWYEIYTMRCNHVGQWFALIFLWPVWFVRAVVRGIREVWDET